MNKNDFLSLIGNKNPIDRQVLAELNELVNIFPYFQTAHLLLLKGLQDNSDIRFENQLKNSAIHIADREVLYNLLKITPGSIEQKYPVELQDSEIQEAVSQIEAATTETKEPVTTSIPEELPENQHPEIPDESPEDLSHYDIPADQSEEGTDIDMEQTVIESAKNSEDFIVEIEKDYGTMPELGKDDETEHVINRSILVSVESDDESIERSIIMIEEESSEQEDKVFYMDPGFSIPEQEDKSELEIVSGEESQTEPVMEDETLSVLISEENKFSEQTLDEQRKKTQSDLIDKFISESPRIEPRRETSDQPNDDLAEQFTEEQGGFVTETLARIYINQGYYSKAIDIYEKLSLKFPEKSDYFATQIEKIKAIIK
jgi:hypothetical protein